MAEFSTPTNLGSSSNGRTSRLQRENARPIRAGSMGPSSNGRTSRSQRENACSNHVGSTAGETQVRFLFCGLRSPRYARIRWRRFQWCNWKAYPGLGAIVQREDTRLAVWE